MLSILVFPLFIVSTFSFITNSGFVKRSSISTTLHSSNNNAVLAVNLNVKSINDSLNFYTNIMGLKVIDSPSEHSCKLSVATADAKDASNFPTLKLMSGSTKYLAGDAFQGLSVKLPDASKSFEKSSDFGGEIVMELNDYSYGASLHPDEEELTNFPARYGRITDPNGLTMEIMNGDNNPYPSMKLILNVLDLDESISFYTKALGMKLLRKRSNVNNRPRDASFSAYVGYGQEKDDFCIELHYKYATEKLDVGNILEIGIGASDTEAFKNHILAFDKNRAVVVEEGRSLSLTDPNGYTIKITPLRPGYIV